MGPLALTLAYLRRRPWGTALNVLLLALGVASIVALVLVGGQVTRGVERDAAGVDLVVGAKGSPLQLVLSSVYHVDAPTGNVGVAEVEAALDTRAVASWTPLALGDALGGHRVVGTTPDWLDRYDAAPREGRLWEAEGEVVLGAEAAAGLGLGLGDTAVSAHGLSDETRSGAHDEHPLTVVGVLAPTGTVADRLVLTSVETVWAAHEMGPGPPDPRPPDPSRGSGSVPLAGGQGVAAQGDGAAGDELAGDGAADDEGTGEEVAGGELPPPPEGTTAAMPPPPPGGGAAGAPLAGAPPAGPPRQYTAVLVEYASPLAAALLPRAINGGTTLQAASPAVESQRLLGLLGVGLGALRVFGLVLVLAAALGVAVALANALRERRTDLAVMRTLGAGRGRILAQVLLEGVLLAGAGALLGLALGHAAVAALAAATAGTRTPLPVSAGAFDPAELWIVLGVVALGALAALVPALQAYRTDPARTLARS